MPHSSLQNRFDQKELEVSALLEITQAVNNNLPEEDLYKIYEFTLRANLRLDKMTLYVLEDEWECKVQFGTSKDFTKVAIGPSCLEVSEATEIRKLNLDVPCFSEFDIIIPVKHKDRLLAFVFLKVKTEIEDLIDTTFIQALSNIILVAIENKRLARKQLDQQALQRDIEIASDVQNFLFPKDLPRTEKIEIKAFYQPCQTVGGDYYDYIELQNQNGFVVCIADVSGKGVPAAILMSNFQAVLRTIIRTAQNPKDVVTELNYQLGRNGNRENFITFFLGIYDYDTRELRYINAGHNPPVMMNGKAEVQLLTVGTTVLGAFDPLPFLEMGTVKNLDEFSLFLYTDGLTETFDNMDAEYGTDRLEAFLQKNYGRPLDDVHQELLQELDDYRKSHPFTDDLTFLSCRVKNGTA
jgi:sigma-B regulation protein RsbU (phosphoserine phosphatase)